MGFLRRYGWALIIAVAIMWTPFMYEIARRSLGPEPAPGAAAVAPPAAPASDAELLRLQREMDDLSIGLDTLLDRVERLEEELERRGDAGPRNTPASANAPAPASSAAGDIPAAAVRYVALVRPPERRTVNDTLDPSGHAWLADFFGPPRVAGDYTQDCKEPDNPRLRANLELRDVGPFRVRMLKPALDSLERIFARIREEEPELHDILGSAGSLCGRLVRGSADRVSGHAYGAALDITIAGSLDRMGDAKTQLGLVLLHEYFREEGWFWGVAFRREDSMHFEVSRQTLEAWKAQGAFDTAHARPAARVRKAEQPEIVQ